jgi:acylphosphatase
MEQSRIVFTGKVQGVFFRYTYQKAMESLVGYVKNLQNRAAEVVVQGKITKVDELIKYCSEAQPYAKVERVTVERYDLEKDWSEFSIRH